MPPTRALRKIPGPARPDGRWRAGRGLLVRGATGTGKTFVSCAVGQQACRKGYRVRYYRCSRLLDELSRARADGSYPKLLGRLARFDLLILDDFLMSPPTESQRRDLLEVLEDR